MPSETEWFALLLALVGVVAGAIASVIGLSDLSPNDGNDTFYNNCP